MTDEEFEQLVNDGIAAIPKKFLKLTNNVAIVIETWPTPRQLQKFGLRGGQTLFGLYEGVPQTKRGPFYSALPDKITIFRGPIEQVAQSPEAIKELVKTTVWHEVAHHFGMDDASIYKAQRNRRSLNK